MNASKWLSMTIYRAQGGWIARESHEGGFAYTFAPEHILVSNDEVLQWVAERMKEYDAKAAEEAPK